MSVSVTITPGYQFPTDGSVAITYALLNLLGQPTVAIDGAIGTLALADASVTTAKLANSALAASAAGRGKMQDGFFAADATGRAKFAAGFFGASDATSLAFFGDNFWTADAAGRAKVQDGFVTLAKLSTAIVADAPSKATPTGADLLLIADAATGNTTKQATINAVQSAQTFVSAEQTVSQNNVTIAVAHGLGAVPRTVRWVLVCKLSDVGYSPGNEVDLSTVRDSGTGGSHYSLGANATNVFLVSASAGNIQVYNYIVRSHDTIEPTSWKFKCYASLV